MLRVATVVPSSHSRFIRFALVGMSSFIIDFTILTLLKLWGMPTLPANTVAFLAAMTNGYFLNRYWTYGDQSYNQCIAQFCQFLLISSTAFVINNALVVSLEEPIGLLIGQPEQGFMPAKVLATAVLTGWNFFANHYWTFKH